jgi:hypothetical protein
VDVWPCFYRLSKELNSQTNYFSRIDLCLNYGDSTASISNRGQSNNNSVDLQMRSLDCAENVFATQHNSWKKQRFLSDP